MPHWRKYIGRQNIYEHLRGYKQEYRDSCENQSRLIDNFLFCHPEINLVSEKVDNGFSGLFFDRPAFNELISEIKSGHIDCVIVKDLSRIGRNYIEVGRLSARFLSYPSYPVYFSEGQY